jgi:hypothetical protein
MSDGQLPTIPATRQAAAIPGRSRRGAVTGKLRTALDLMVWSGEKRAGYVIDLTDDRPPSDAPISI